MFVADHGGAGFVPLQDFTPNMPLPYRCVRYATRVTGRSAQTANYETSNDSRLTEGDILCATLWYNEVPGNTPKDSQPTTIAKARNLAAERAAQQSAAASQGEGTKTRDSVSLRPMPGWAHAWPAVTMEDVKQQQGGGGTQTKPTGTSTTSAPPNTTQTRPKGLTGNLEVSQARFKSGPRTGAGARVKLRPVKKEDWKPDLRFEELEASLPTQIDALPKDTPGIMIGGTNERAQENLFFPIMPGSLVAPHRSGPPERGSLVYDIDPDGKLSQTYRARLQSVFRVVRPAAESVAWLLGASALDGLHGYGIMYGSAGPSLGKSESKDDLPKKGDPGETDDPTKTRTRDQSSQTPPGGAPAGGGTTTRPSPGTSERPAPGVIGYMALKKGGPIDLGSMADVHNHGTSLDGEPLNAAHCSTKTLFRGHGGDAALEFQKVAYKITGRGPIRVPAHLRYDANATHEWGDGRSGPGLWRFESEATSYVPPDPKKYKIPFGPCTTPPPPQPPPPQPPPHPPEPPPPSGSCDRAPEGGRVPGTPWGFTGGSQAGSGTRIARDTQSLAGDIGGTRTRGQGQEGTSTGPRTKEHPAGHPGPAVGIGTQGGSRVRDYKEAVQEAYQSGAAAEQEDIISEVEEMIQSEGTRAPNTPMPPPPSEPQQKVLPDPWDVYNQATVPSDTTQRPVLMTTFPMVVALSGMVTRPQMVGVGSPDMRHKVNPDEYQVNLLERTPATSRFEAFGAQQAGEWVRTNSVRTGPYVGGTANGGIAFMPPEVQIADRERNFVPSSGFSKSTTTFAVTGGAHLGVSRSLDEGTGRVKDGFDLSNDSSGNLELLGRNTSSVDQGKHTLYQNGEIKSLDASTARVFTTEGGALGIKDLGGDPSTIASVGRFYSKSGAPFYMSPAGAVTSLTPSPSGGRGTPQPLNITTSWDGSGTVNAIATYSQDGSWIYGKVVIDIGGAQSGNFTFTLDDYTVTEANMPIGNLGYAPVGFGILDDQGSTTLYEVTVLWDAANNRFTLAYNSSGAAMTFVSNTNPFTVANPDSFEFTFECEVTPV